MKGETMPEIIPIQVEKVRLVPRGYKRNGNGILCPDYLVRSWYVQRYIVRGKNGEQSEPMTRKEALRYSENP
jgi:hypothetical protein